MLEAGHKYLPPFGDGLEKQRIAQIARARKSSLLFVSSGSEIVRRSSPLWQTVPTMLIELWERLRGYDKWIAADATITRSDVQKIPVTDRYSGQVIDYNYASGDVLTWTDPSGEQQYAGFDVPDDSPLYQLIGGETVSIRYNPANPDQFYYRDLLKTHVHTAVKTTAIILIVALVLLGYILLRASSH
jgi:Protein of unknown function (DUF3592)